MNEEVWDELYGDFYGDPEDSESVSFGDDDEDPRRA